MRCDIYVAPGSWTPEPLARHNFTSSTIMWSISNITSNCVIAMHGKAIKESMTHPEVNGAIATRLYRLHATIETYQVHTSTPYLSTFECLATTSHGKRARSRRYIALIWFNVRRIRWLKLNVTVARSWRKWTAKNENKWKRESDQFAVHKLHTHTHAHTHACVHAYIRSMWIPSRIRCVSEEHCSFFCLRNYFHFHFVSTLLRLPSAIVLTRGTHVVWIVVVV